MGILFALPFMIYAGYKDWQERIIPNIVPLALLIVGSIDFFISSSCGGENVIIFSPTLLNRISGAVIPLIVLLIAYFINPRSSGGGDLKLLPTFGFCVGLYSLFFVLLITALGGIIHYIKTKDIYIPLASYMAVGVICNMAFILLAMTR